MRNLKEVVLSSGEVLEREIRKPRPILVEEDLNGVNLDGTNLDFAYMRGADLHGANLRGTNLSNADLREANASEANMTMADLHGANLSGTNLTRANLYRANLTRANLYGANLHGANLYFSNLSGAENIISIGPIGSRGDILYAVRWETGLMVKTGCFWGTLEEFESAVLKTHGKPADRRVSNEYRRAIDLISTWGSRIYGDEHDG